jgi:bifunctional ADP-heptose synthase (sugar kinase/adenylyltransferase)
VSGDLESSILAYLRTEIPRYDLVLVSDFGHGIVSNTMIAAIEAAAPRLAVNAQTNGANAGYNLITKYHRSSLICMDVPEARLATQDKYSDIRTVGEKILKATNTDHLMITLGGNGSICLIKDGASIHTPAIATKVIDVIGAGDAFFAYTAPCIARDMPADLVSFIGNAVGAIAVQIVGNKKPVEKHEVLEFIHTVLKEK